ncbi:ABC transporter permease [Aerosakkonemataceae cyanobacterium BLCC-F50]|uniref:ABC transporter permease n=1 Tax=Floridaenema flaviceps BLCC-F50 TaxID=3153642 RepID=A0ABV4XXJ6_9CYAN
MQVILANIMAIYRRELQSYFASPLAYAIACVFWIISGLMFVYILLDPQQGLIAQVAFRDQQLGANAPPVDLPYTFQQLFLGNVMSSLALFVLPMLSMGLYAEERKRGTLELLATSPITNWSVAVGKLLGALTFFIFMISPLWLYQAIAFSSSTPPVKPTIPMMGFLALILLAASVLSLGMFISSLTDSTLLAAVFTFVLIMSLWILDLIGKSISGPVGAALTHLSLLTHFSILVQGIIDTSSIILFASYIILGVFLTAQSVDTFRFQRS